MKVLVTAGSTQTPIDKVRCISNIFKGSTGFNIAKAIGYAGNEVVLIANKKVLYEYLGDLPNRFDIHTYKTYDELAELMARLIPDGEFDAIIHSAAVSDYKATDVMVGEKVTIDGVTKPVYMKSVMKGKVKSDHDELYIKLERTEKLIDKIRTEWGFEGKLIKFKLEVDVTDEELLSIAKSSREHSGADYIVANALDTFKDWDTPSMFILGNELQEKTSRRELPMKLHKLLEKK